MKKTLFLFALLCCITATYVESDELPFFVKLFQVQKVEVPEAQSVIEIAMDYYGFDAKNNKKELKSLMAVDPTKVPWCAGFTNSILDKAGFSSPNNLLASSYHKYGVKVKKTEEPQPGDIVITKRNGGSNRHVAFYYGSYHDKGIKYIQMLGGNQNNGVNIKPVPASKVVEYRRPVKRYT